MINKLKSRVGSIWSTRNKEKGFTIIEVLIVLVIAGLIMLIVFLAVPALQRNSRNTQRKSDAARVSSATAEYRNNNQSQWPQSASDVTGLVGTLGFYNTSQVVLVPTAESASLVGAYTGSTDNWINGGFTPLANMYILLNTSCTGGTQLATRAGQVTVVHAIESGNTTVARCV